MPTTATATGVPTAPNSVVTVTPELAASWLEHHNKRNRPLRKQTVAKYARDMEHKRWRYNGESIQFDTTGNLINGQHRLNAIVKSGKAQPILIVTGLDPEVHETVDTGNKRTPGDVLTLNGFTNGRTLAAVAGMSFLLDNVGEGGVKLMKHRSTADIMARVESDPHMVEVVEEIVPALNVPAVLMTRTVACYAYYRLSKIDKTACEEFFISLLTLANLPEGSPIIALHRRLVGHAAERTVGQKSAYEAIAYVFSAWNAWRNGETRQHIKLARSSEGRLRIAQPE